jgi:putative phosphoserine phosphatase/1-acylglycerol-3-phosphate O-acyltransferase
MALYKDVTRAVNDAPDGPQIGAFFDFDGTLMAGFSATEFFKEQIKRGELSVNDFVETVSTIGSFSLGKIGFSGLMTARGQLYRVRRRGLRKADREADLSRVARAGQSASRQRSHRGHRVIGDTLPGRSACT